MPEVSRGRLPVVRRWVAMSALAQYAAVAVALIWALALSVWTWLTVTARHGEGRWWSL